MINQNYAMLKNIAIYKNMPEPEKAKKRFINPIECGLMDKIIDGKNAKDLLKKQVQRLAGENTSLLNKVKEKNLFEREMMHDLANPYNGLLGFIEVMNEEKLTPDQREMFDVIARTAKKEFALLQSFQMIIRSETTLYDAKPSTFNLNTVVQNGVELLGANAKLKGVNVQNDVGTGVLANADKYIFGQMISNLVSNAIKFTYKGGNIIVRAEENGEFVAVSVSDNGVGIPADVLPNLLGSAGNNSTRGTDGEVGTGLGLKVCKDMAEKNGGTIRIESVEGKGTTVSFTLPKAETA
ncbi:MAG: HAMP domain-containing sensor histidine kinase [Candidatus Micrarchaeota archaeon]|nr:HAMP domain-containing sensor histidine kinase [Candidatus Micrarchaeota archaeon]